MSNSDTNDFSNEPHSLIPNGQDGEAPPNGRTEISTQDDVVNKITEEMSPNEYSRFMEEQWRELETDERDFWEKIQKRKIIYRGIVSDIAQVGGGLRKDYSFICTRDPPQDLPLPSIRVKFHTRKEIDEVISEGETVLLLGKLKKGKPFEPEKMFNQTRHISFDL